MIVLIDIEVFEFAFRDAPSDWVQDCTVGAMTAPTVQYRILILCFSKTLFRLAQHHIMMLLTRSATLYHVKECGINKSW